MYAIILASSDPWRTVGTPNFRQYLGPLVIEVYCPSTLCL